MEPGDALRRRLEELQKRSGVRKRLYDIAQEASMRAVEETIEHTPPNSDDEDKERGVGMITGELAQSWEKDSQTEPVVAGDEYLTVLASNVEYASYVNNGHNMSQHFVPGLIVDPQTGLLQRVDPPTYEDDKGKKHLIGIVVGTKTKKVEGVYMLEKGVDKYKEVVSAEFARLVQEVFGG